MDEEKISDKFTMIELLSDSYNSGSIATLDSLVAALVAMGQENPNQTYTIGDMIAICHEFREMVIEDVESEEDEFFNSIADEFKALEDDDELEIPDEYYDELIEEQQDKPQFDEFGRPIGKKVIH